MKKQFNLSFVKKHKLMRTFKYFLLLTGMTLFAANIFAQDQNNPDPVAMAQKMTAEVKRVVPSITSDQETKITAIEQDYAKGMNAARTNSGDDRAAMRSKMQPLKATRDAQIKTILTADQYAQYEKAEAAHTSNAHVHKSTN